MTKTLIAKPDVVARLRAQLPAVTRSHLQDRFAISETTWAKLRDGRPIKRVTLERILARLEWANVQATSPN
jgi:DNA-binding Xre family transcriptional regulator